MSFETKVGRLRSLLHFRLDQKEANTQASVDHEQALEAREEAIKNLTNLEVEIKDFADVLIGQSYVILRRRRASQISHHTLLFSPDWTFESRVRKSIAQCRNPLPRASEEAINQPGGRAATCTQLD